MSRQQLIKWKHRAFNYQKDIQAQIPAPQKTLFGSSSIPKADQINPFYLELHPWQFYRMPSQQSQSGCLYFVIDLELPILLYI